MALGGGFDAGRVEERLLLLGEIGCRRRPPLQDGFEAGAAVQLGGRATERLPAVGGGGEVAQDAVTGGVLVEPRPQPRPRSGQRFVGELDGVLLGGDQPGADEQAEHPFAVGVAAERAGRDTRANRFTVGRRGDEAQQHRAQLWALLGGKALVEPVGGAGDGPADLPGGPVPLDGEHTAVAPPPRLGQGVRQQRQGTGLALDVAHQQVDQPALRGAARPAPPGLRSPRAASHR